MALRDWLAPDTTRLVSFNQRNRDDWVAGVAARLPRGTTLLDVGAGQCPYRSLFEHCEYRTHDFAQYEGTDEGLLRDVWEYGRIDYVSDIRELPIPDASFDAVLCTEVLEHVPDPLGAIAEIGRILRPGGQLFMTAPLMSGLHQEPYHFYGGFTPHFYNWALPSAGLEVVSIEPNAGFFRQLLQELNRAADILQERRGYRVWHPMHWLLRVGFKGIAPVWLSRVDDDVPVPEFTVGYHVEARRAEVDTA